MEDIRIGRKTNSTEKFFTPPVGSFAQVLGPNDNRVAIVFNIPDSSNWILFSTIEGNTSGTGLRLTVQHPTITLTIETHGDLVRRPWFVRCDIAIQCAVFEIFLPDQ